MTVFVSKVVQTIHKPDTCTILYMHYHWYMYLITPRECAAIHKLEASYGFRKPASSVHDTEIWPAVFMLFDI